MWGGLDRYNGTYTENGYFISTTITEGNRMGRTISDFIVKQNFPEHDKIRGRVGHTLTLLDDGRVMLFGGKQRPNQETCSPRDMYRDSTPGGIFTMGTDDLYWREATVEGDIPEGRAYHSTIKVGGKLYVIGGVCIEGTEVKNAHSYLLTYNTISGTFHSPCIQLQSPIYISHHTCNILNDTLVLSGGYNIDDTMNDKTYAIDIHDVNNIHILPTGFKNTTHHTLVFESKIYAFGGDQKYVWVFKRETEEASNEEVNDEEMNLNEERNEVSDRIEEPEVRSEESEDEEQGVEQGDESEEGDGSEEEVVDGLVCFMQKECVNANASDSVRNKLLSCAECDQFFHLFCIGHATDPFRSEEQKDNSLFYCKSCRTLHKDKLQMSRRQWNTMESNLGIVKANLY